MAGKTKIQWCTDSWNPIAGCSVLSPGCTNCYAMKMADRIQRMSAKQTHYAGTTQPSKAGPVWTGKLVQAPDDILLKPLKWKRPRMIFVNSMSDLFHENVPDEWIDRVFSVMASARQHTFQVLTKRAERMRAYLSGASMRIWTAMPKVDQSSLGCAQPHWPLPNVWLGISAEDQTRADERIPHLLATPAAVRFLSAEPLLAPIDLTGCMLPDTRHQRNCTYVTSLGPAPCTCSAIHGGLDWIIVGGESGRDARPMHPEWARSIRDQCQAAGVPFFMKQWGEWYPHERGIDGSLPATLVGVDGDSAHIMARLGKRAAGRLLDGREWNDMPGDVT